MWRQVAASFVPMLGMRFRKDGPGAMRFLGVIIAAYFTLAAPIIVFHAAVPNMTPLKSLMLDLPVPALALLLAVMNLISTAASWGQEPLWYQAVLTGSLFGSVWIGGAWARKVRNNE